MLSELSKEPTALFSTLSMDKSKDRTKKLIKNSFQTNSKTSGRFDIYLLKFRFYLQLIATHEDTLSSAS